MTIKATQLYLRIAEQMKVARKDDLKRVAQIQEALMLEGRFVPYGDLLIEEGLVDADTNRGVLAQHSFNNMREDDKILGGWLVDQGKATTEAVDAGFARAREAMGQGETRIPRLATFLASSGKLAAADKDLALSIDRELATPLHEMTRYFAEFGDGGSQEITDGRIVYQCEIATRDDLFATLLTRILSHSKAGLLVGLASIAPFDDAATEKIRATRERFVQGD